MNTQVELSKIAINEQIVFSGKREDIFIGTIVQETEKAVKVDYCFESVWSNCGITVYTFSTWIPKSVLTHNELGCLTVKKWFINKFDGSSSHRIKRYYQKGEEKIFV